MTRLKIRRVISRYCLNIKHFPRTLKCIVLKKAQSIFSRD